MRGLIEPLEHCSAEIIVGFTLRFKNSAVKLRSVRYIAYIINPLAFRSPITSYPCDVQHRGTFLHLRNHGIRLFVAEDDNRYLFMAIFPGEFVYLSLYGGYVRREVSGRWVWILNRFCYLYFILLKLWNHTLLQPLTPCITQIRDADRFYPEF